MLSAYCGIVAVKALLISLGLLDGSYELSLGCFADLEVVLPGDFLDLVELHSVLSSVVGTRAGNYLANIASSV